jgi:hypothetical protein
MDDTELLDSDSIALCLGLSCRLFVSTRAGRMLNGIDICDAVTHLVAASGGSIKLLKGEYRSLIKNRVFTVKLNEEENAVYVRYGQGN